MISYRQYPESYRHNHQTLINSLRYIVLESTFILYSSSVWKQKFNLIYIGKDLIYSMVVSFGNDSINSLSLIG